MADMLEKVRRSLGNMSEYLNDTLNEYIEEVQRYMIDGGVPRAVAKSDVSAGAIARGVMDLWNYGASGGKLSEYFYQRVTQLVYALQTGRIICFGVGDYGLIYPVQIEGVEIAATDSAVFGCGDLTKEYSLKDGCVLVSFSEDESNLLKRGTYSWSIKLKKGAALITVVNDGLLIVD